MSPIDRDTKETEKRAVGHRVTEARVAAGLTVAEMARRADLPRQYIYDLEGGVRVSITNVAGAARALGVSVDFLLGNEREDAAHSRTHSCCETAADLDATARFTQAARWLLQQADGGYAPSGPTALRFSVMELTHGSRVRLHRCGLYSWRGAMYRVGEASSLPHHHERNNEKGNAEDDADHVEGND